MDKCCNNCSNIKNKDKETTCMVWGMNIQPFDDIMNSLVCSKWEEKEDKQDNLNKKKTTWLTNTLSKKIEGIYNKWI